MGVAPGDLVNEVGRDMVGVAQSVEHLVVVQEAAGSSPVTHPTEQGPDFGSGPVFVQWSRRLRAAVRHTVRHQFPARYA